MRVCHVGFNYFPGRGLTIFYEFARNQAQQGLQVSVIAPGRPDEPRLQVIDGIRVHRIPLASIGRFSLDRIRFLIRAAQILRSDAFDLVHVYAFVGAGPLPLLAGRRRSKWLYDCQSSAIKPPLLRLQNRLIRVEASPFDGITVLSEGIRDIVFGAGRSVQAIVPLGANFEHFKPGPADPALLSRLGFAGTDCIFAYCGTLDQNRRIDRLLAAFSSVARKAETARLLIIGEGSELEALKKQARYMGLENRIVFTGFVPYVDVPACLSLARVALAFVPMEPHFEHQPPTKTVEYLAQGLPVIATNTAGNRVFVQHGFNGLLCDDRAESVARSMLELIRDTGKGARLAANARDSVRAYDWSEIVRTRVIPVYRDILREGRFAR